VFFAVHPLFGTTADWWEMYRNSHQNVGVVAEEVYTELAMALWLAPPLGRRAVAPRLFWRSKFVYGGGNSS
jgi:hypothetical protein